jgi:Ribosomal protein S5, N-terminal domain
VVVGDSNGHVGLGVKCAKEVATAIRGAIILAKTCAPRAALAPCADTIGGTPRASCLANSCNTSESN